MKLFIINGENNNEEIEIYVDECSITEYIKIKLNEILPGEGTHKLHPFKLIYENVILTSQNTIKYYKMHENDKIWFGKVYKYLEKDDVIVYVYVVVGNNQDYDFMIFKKNDTISTVKSKVERIYCKVINIWNKDGKLMGNDELIADIDPLKDYKLFIKCDDGEGNKTDFTFNNCCELHNKRWVDRYLFLDQIRHDNKNESIRMNLMKLINQIKQIISLNDKLDERLNQNLSEMPSSYLDQIYFVTGDLGIHIYSIFSDHYEFLMKYCSDDVRKIVAYYLFFPIRISLANFFNSRKQIINLNNSENSKNELNKSIKSIVIDVLDFFMEYLSDSNNDWQYWLRLWMNLYIIGCFSESQLEERIKAHAERGFQIPIKYRGNSHRKFITFKPKTVLDAREKISILLAVEMKHLYCICPGGDNKPDDEVAFDSTFIIEIIRSMDDIEILKKIDKGGFAKISLYQDKISKKQFVLKIPNDGGDLSRDINIYSILGSSRIIMNYIGLFMNQGRICIGMEYMTGGSLRSYLKKRKDLYKQGKKEYLSEKEIVKISYEILTQINELHKLGIIHRDIKSDNIVLDEHNNSKLIDVGIAKLMVELRSKASLDELQAYPFGTEEYWAPELKEKKAYSNKIDIWSFGMVIAEMVTGKRPDQALTDFTKHEFELNFSISIRLNDFIEKCLTKNQEERPSAEQLIKFELFIDFIEQQKCFNKLQILN